jgi:hypothetical protein
MKKIGFIDYYLDEWHANNYPEMIHTNSNGEMEVCCAYGKIDSPHNGMTNKEWAEKYKIELLPTMEEVIQKSDCIIVLSPDNPEMHEELTKLPVSCGKLVYIDKTFAPDREAAKRIFDRADSYHTPCYSCSALNFSTELKEIDKNNISVMNSIGTGTYEMYSIHQIEPIVSLMGTDAKRVMFVGNDQNPSAIIEFSDGRRAQISHFWGLPFSMNIGFKDGSSKHVEIESDYFSLFIKALIEYFKTGIIPVPHEQTLAVIAIRAAGLQAMQNPFTWVNL